MYNKNMEISREYKVVSLHTLNAFMNKFITSGDLSVVDSYKSEATDILLSPKQSCKNILDLQITELAIELISLMFECFKTEGIDYSDERIKEFLGIVKEKLPDEFKTMNGAQILKLMRDAMAHNSESVRNFDSDVDGYKMRIKSKSGGEDIILKFTNEDILNILLAYDLARITTWVSGSINIDSKASSVNELLSERKRKGSFSNFITTENDKGEADSVDQFQDSAYLRFLVKNKKRFSEWGNYEYIIYRFFPLKDNKLNNFEFKFRLLEMLLILREGLLENDNITHREYLRELNRAKDICAKICMSDPELFKSISYSSMCYSMFSTRTNAELAEIFDLAGLDFTEDEIRHIRNSFVHKRYFYNFKDGYEIYDGRKELSHILTLRFSEIEKIYEIYIKNVKEIIQKERLKYKLSKLFEEGNTI